MLRTVILAFFAIGFACETIAEALPELDISKAKKTAKEKTQKIEALIKDKEFQKLISKERTKLKTIQFNKGPRMNLESDFLEEKRTDRYLSSSIEASKKIDSEVNLKNLNEIYPIALISFTMPDEDIQALMVEAKKIGAAIALRGMVDNDFKKTIDKFQSLATKNGTGIAIDPTLFQRFSVSAVPAFILPLEPLGLCDKDKCPTPRYVKLTGSVDFRYFLETVESSGSKEEAEEAAKWLSKYE